MAGRKAPHELHHYKIGDFLRWIEEIKDKSRDPKWLVVTLHKEDARKLAVFGIHGVLWIDETRPLQDFIDSLLDKKKDCVLLFDLTPKGNALFKRIEQALNNAGLYVDHKLRDFMASTQCKRVHEIIEYIDKHLLTQRVMK